MIKTLKKRFILTAMAAVTLLIFILLSGINIFNIIFMNEQSEKTMEFLAQRNVAMPPEKPDFIQGEKDFFGKPMDDDTAEASRHFTVSLNEKNEIIHIDVSRISAVDESEARIICQRVLDKNKFNGYTNKFKYLTLKNNFISFEEADTIMVFLDVSNVYQNVLSVLFLSVVFGIAAWLLMLVVVTLLSNKAIKPIAENIEKQKQFITDAGHEIKTPLAIILANTQALELHNGESKWSKNIKNQTNRLNELTKNLLTLSKAEENINLNYGEHLKETNISVFLKEACEAFKEPCELNEKILNCNIQNHCFAKICGDDIKRVFNILLDNAYKYSQENSEINLGLLRENNKIIFKISNSCERLPDVLPEKLFDRFYRADESRTQKSGGYGIGLSVAKAIIEGNGGIIYATYSNNNKIEFTVEL